MKKNAVEGEDTDKKIGLWTPAKFSYYSVKKLQMIVV